MDDNVKDPRSTGRKRGRRVLEREGLPYWCGSTRDGGVSPDRGDGKPFCGRSPTEPDAPGGMWPGMGSLQVNHKNKNVMDNDPANLQWACPSCHKIADSQTEKGVSTKADEFGYSTLNVLDLLGDDGEEESEEPWN